MGIVLIENQKVSVSVPALNALVSNNCAVVYCDSKHMPSSMLLSLTLTPFKEKDSVSRQKPLFL